MFNFSINRYTKCQADLVGHKYDILFNGIY